MSPKLAALLGLVAVAGWQNRDKISSFVNGISPGGAQASAVPGGVAGALGGLVSHMQAGGAADAVNSWVGTGQNQAINSGQLQQALGPDLINKIAAATGLPPDQLLKQLSTVLPQVVDQLTPNGKLPV